jgi:hypothetical protein
MTRKPCCAPSTSSRLDRTEPTSDIATTSYRPLESAARLRMSSTLHRDTEGCYARAVAKREDPQQSCHLRYCLQCMGLHDT